VDISDIKKLIKCSNGLKTGVGLGYPLTNALKILNKELTVIDNIKRNNMFLSFTPQIFNFLKLFDSYKKVIKNKTEVDDELEAMHINSYKVKIMISSPRNIKLTYKEDLKVLSDLIPKQ
jgi:2-C-methyl-D-erythritol 4-phosphate cytidylyltransferase